MRKVLYLLLFIGAYFNLLSQPTITINSIPLIGESYTFTYCDTLGVRPGDAGANVTWDFSKLIKQTGTDATYTYDIVNPQVGIKSNLFTTADYAYKSEDAYGYYKIGTAYIERLGTGYDAGSEVLSDPEVFFGYPFTFSNTLDDEFAGVITTTMQGATVELNRYGRVLTVADAYGTLILPQGTFYNLLRLKTVQQISDTLEPIIPGTPQIIVKTETTTYSWVNDNFKFSLLSISTIKSSQIIMGNETSVIYSNVVAIQDEAPTEQILTTPSILSPENGTQGLEIPFDIEWSKSEYINPGSIKSDEAPIINYHLQISSDMTFTDAENLVEYQIENETKYNFKEQVTVEDLYIRVKASYEGLESDWSEIFSIQVVASTEATISTPEITSPVSGSENLDLPLIIEWSESEVVIPGKVESISEDEILYYLELSLLEDFSDVDYMIIYEPITGNAIELGTDFELAGENVFARVKSSYGELESEWSEVINFSVNSNTEKPLTPVLLTPVDGAEDLPIFKVRFEWSYPGDDENITYQFRIRSANESLEFFNGSDNFYESDLLELGTKYYWSVRADKSMSQDTSEWAEEWSFTTTPVVSVNNLKVNSEDLKVAPNPANEYINLNLNIEFPENYTMKVFNIEGALLSESLLGLLESGLHNIDYNTANLANGSYIISVEGTQSRLMRTIVINR